MPKVTKGKTGARPDKTKERPIHPYSRKAVKLGKQAIHDKKVENAKSAQITKLELLAEKLQWFKDRLDDRRIYTKKDLLDLVMLYRSRFDDELDQINIVHSIGNRQTQSRQHASRESAIRITTDNENNQFEGSGIEVPDLMNRKHLDEFKKWDGELNLLQNLKLRKISRKDAERVQTETETKDNQCCETVDEEGIE